MGRSGGNNSKIWGLKGVICKTMITEITEIVHQYNFMDEMGRRSFNDSVDCAQ